MPQNNFLRSLTKYPTRAYFRFKYRLSSYYSSPTHNFPSYKPLQLWWLSPDDVELMMKPGYELSRDYNPGVVLDGDWDTETKPFKESIYYQSFKAHFVDDEPWDNTPLYRSALNRSPDSYWHGCSTESQIRKKLQYYTNVYHSIAEHGFLTQRELQKKGLMIQNLTPPEQGEIRINIDRNGRILFDEGRHRFAITKILNIKQIPVIIMGRHKKWLNSSKGNNTSPIRSSPK